MKIKKLDIYGFGKHENKTIDFSENVNVIYGRNEAGKTTIQQFILQILFGFPQKNSTQLRYEPKSGGKYGGRIYIDDAIYGECMVERIRGKSSGEVTVQFKDGTQGGEEALNAIVRQYDRASFESVFSFSVLQLQGFEKMDETELSRTLLASGTTGIDSLMLLEKKMEKEAGDLFKKSGRVPEMNVLLQQLKELEDDLKKERDRLSSYSPKVRRISEIEQQWAEVKKQHEQLISENRQLDAQLQSLPLYRRKKVLMDQLADVRTDHFPAEGVRRYETAHSRLTETKVKLRGLEEEIRSIRDRLEKNADVERLAEIQKLLAREPEWHEWHADVNTCTESMRQLTAKKLRLLDRLGLTGAEEILASDVSIHKEEQLYEQLQKLTEMDQQLGYVDRQLSEVEHERKDLKSQRDALQEKAPSTSEEKQIEEWPHNRGKLAEARVYVNTRQKNATSGNAMVPLLLLVAAAGTIVYGLTEKQWVVVTFGLVIAAGAAYLLTRKHNQTGETMHADMQRIIEEVGGTEQQMERLVEKMHAYRSQQSRLHESFATVERKMVKLEGEYEAIAREKEVLENRLHNFFIGYGLAKIPNAGILHEFFGMARSVQETERELLHSQAQQRMLKNRITARSEEIEVLVGNEGPEQTLYERLRAAYMSLRSAEQVQTGLSERLEEILVEKKDADELLAAYSQQIEALFHEAGVQTEGHYYEAQKNAERTLMLMSQIEDIKAQLANAPPIDRHAEVTEEEMKMAVSDNEEQIAKLENELDLLLEEKASLKAETDRLLTDEVYQTKQQFFEMKKAEFAELADRWAVRQAIVQAINGMMKELKDRKLPAVLEQAEDLFSELTAGVYVGLEITDNGLFRAVANDGTRFPIIELSQATKEQAYISLRLSLAIAMEKTAPFPILMDDPFVHFDGERLKRMLAIVGQLSEKHQFIYMTCHDKIREEWTTARIINVSAIGNDKGAIAT